MKGDNHDLPVPAAAKKPAPQATGEATIDAAKASPNVDSEAEAENTVDAEKVSSSDLAHATTF